MSPPHEVSPPLRHPTKFSARASLRYFAGTPTRSSEYFAGTPTRSSEYFAGTPGLT